jgi:hypothetical protein
MKLRNASLQNGRAVLRPKGDDWALEASPCLPTAYSPPVPFDLCQPPQNANYYYQHTLNKTARRLHGNLEKCAGGGSVTVRGRCEIFVSPTAARASHGHAAAILLFWVYEIIQYDVGVTYSGTTFILSLPKIDQLTQNFKRTHTYSHAHRQYSHPISLPCSLRTESRLNTENVNISRDSWSSNNYNLKFLWKHALKSQSSPELPNTIQERYRV